MIQMESTYLDLNNTRLQKAVSEYTSLPPCGIPNCSRHNSKDTPLKLNAPDPSPPPTPIPTKRKENSEGFTSPPSRKLTKSTLSNSNTDLNFKINLTNTFSALDNTASVETPVTTHKSPVNTLTKLTSLFNYRSCLPHHVTDNGRPRSRIKTLTGKMPALRCRKIHQLQCFFYPDDGIYHFWTLDSSPRSPLLNHHRAPDRTAPSCRVHHKWNLQPYVKNCDTLVSIADKNYLLCVFLYF
ncbi:hypothetical protein TNCV_1775881 [Trichonephila clavipes]|nr:hypothetical protein TNCV_1775881 [Trichonephila clavipes]